MKEGGRDCLPAEVLTGDVSRSVVQQLQLRILPVNSQPAVGHKAIILKLSDFEWVVGLLCIALSIVTIVITPDEQWKYNESTTRRSYTNFVTIFTYTCQGIWAGMFGVISGMLGRRRVRGMHAALSSHSHTTPAPTCNMAMCITTSVVNGVAVILSAFASLLSTGSTALLALHIVIALLSFGLMIITIVHAAFCCKEDCTCVGSPVVIEPTVYITEPSQVGLPKSSASIDPDEMSTTENRKQILMQYPDRYEELF